MLTNILGKLNLRPIMYILIISMVVTPFYTYHMAISKKQQPPYPHVTVTDTATHYPQDIVFRYFMLINSSFLAFVFFLIFRWVESEARRIGYHKPPKYQFYLAEGSIVCYGITIGTIDEQGIGKLHGPCAVIFFVIWLVTIVNMTVTITKMRQWDTSVISITSLRIKQILALYISALWGWCLYKISQQSQLNKQDIYVVIVQWNSVMINLFWVLSMVLEWKHFKICLSANK